MFDRDHLKTTLDALAAKGVFIGTSSWKYPGWRGMLYDEQRYVYHGKFGEKRFEKNCLAEYAEVFRTVCVDAGFFVEGFINYGRAGWFFDLEVNRKRSNGKQRLALCNRADSYLRLQ
ncbi:MAG: hypothetical protein JWQ04_1228 [Pedosphaera sp.]|nr:hypothetical protein [Pedosphaera sp.]